MVWWDHDKTEATAAAEENICAEKNISLPIIMREEHEKIRILLSYYCENKKKIMLSNGVHHLENKQILVAREKCLVQYPDDSCRELQLEWFSQ